MGHSQSCLDAWADLCYQFLHFCLRQLSIESVPPECLCLLTVLQVPLLIHPGQLREGRGGEGRGGEGSKLRGAMSRVSIISTCHLGTPYCPRPLHTQALPPPQLCTPPVLGVPEWGSDPAQTYPRPSPGPGAVGTRHSGSGGGCG